MPHNTRAVFSSGWQYPGGRFETKNGRVSYQRPCKTGSASVYKDLAQPVNKVPIVDLVFKYGLALNPPDNDEVQCAGRIYSSFCGRRLTFP